MSLFFNGSTTIMKNNKRIPPIWYEWRTDKVNIFGFYKLKKDTPKEIKIAYRKANLKVIKRRILSPIQHIKSAIMRIEYKISPNYFERKYTNRNTRINKV